MSAHCNIPMNTITPFAHFYIYILFAFKNLYLVQVQINLNCQSQTSDSPNKIHLQQVLPTKYISSTCAMVFRFFLTPGQKLESGSVILRKIYSCKRTWVRFPAITWWLRTICNSSSGESTVLSNPGMQFAHGHMSRQNTHIHVNVK